MEKFYERVMVAMAKVHPPPREQIKRNWFINLLRKKYEKYVNILPSDTLEEALPFAQKVEIGKLNKERMREDNLSEEEKGKS